MATVNGLGIENFFIKLADQLFTSNVVLASIGLGGATGIDIAANETIRVSYWVKFSVGVAGGVRLQLVAPAGGVIFSDSIFLNNTVAAASSIAVVQQASAVFTNAVANAGTHWIQIEAVIVNGATAGTVDLQMAQNTSDVLSLTILRGATAEVTKI